MSETYEDVDGITRTVKTNLNWDYLWDSNENNTQPVTYAADQIGYDASAQAWLDTVHMFGDPIVVEGDTVVGGRSRSVIENAHNEHFWTGGSVHCNEEKVYEVTPATPTNTCADMQCGECFRAVAYEDARNQCCGVLCGHEGCCDYVGGSGTCSPISPTYAGLHNNIQAWCAQSPHSHTRTHTGTKTRACAGSQSCYHLSLQFRLSFRTYRSLRTEL